jgi:hypothetical protein
LPQPEQAEQAEPADRIGSEDEDALDEALMETFPASDPIAISSPRRKERER